LGFGCVDAAGLPVLAEVVDLAELFVAFAGLGASVLDSVCGVVSVPTAPEAEVDAEGVAGACVAALETSSAADCVAAAEGCD
jgi:hypothetical protein